jgi:hypothetical protein
MKIEHERRDFMRDHPTLYAYIEARLVARTWKDAGDTASGAGDQYGAANRCYTQQARWRRRADDMREATPESTEDVRHG